MFSVEHFIWMGLSLAFVVGMTFVSVKYKFSFKTAALIMLGIALACELSKIFSHMEFVNGKDASEGMVIEVTALPLHLCSILIFAYVYLPFSKEGRIRDFITSFSVPVALIGGILSVIMATSGTDFLKPYAYQCFVFHSGMIWFALYLILAKQARLGWREYVQNVLTLAAVALVMIWVNGMFQDFDTNFFFVVRPPIDGMPMLNLDNGWYAYFAHLVFLGLIGVTLVHLPSMIVEFKNRKKEKGASN